MKSGIGIEAYTDSLKTAVNLSIESKRVLRRKRLYNSEVKKVKLDLSRLSGIKSIIIPYEIDGQADSLYSFIEVVKSYCSNIEKGLDYDSIMLYYGISESCVTLKTIGEKNNVTKERVRQIKKVHINNIRKLINGSIVNGLSCDSLVVSQINDLRDKFLRYMFIKKANIHEILKSEGILLTDDTKPHLDLFFDVFKISYTSILHCYITRNIMSIPKVKKLLFKIKKHLYDKILPVSLESMSKKFNVGQSIVKNLIKIIPEAEEVDKNIYQIKNTETSANDLAYRVLSAAKKPINLFDLTSIVNSLRGKSVSGVFLSNYDRLENIGLTGYWTVKSLNVNKDYIYDIIKKALKHFNRACTFLEIYNYVKDIRPDIKYENMTKLIRVGVYKYFLRLKDGKIILIEWKEKYAGKLHNGVKREYNLDTTGKFCSALFDILGNRTMTCGDLSEKISIRTGLSKEGCLNRVYTSKLVVLNRSCTPRTVSLKSNAKKILYDKLNNSRESIIKTLVSIFVNQDKEELSRKYIIKEIIEKHSISKPFLYALLRDKKLFVIGNKCGRSSLIRLNPEFKNG